MVNVYVNLIMAGKRTIDQVPMKWRKDVEDKLKELGAN